MIAAPRIDGQLCVVNCGLPGDQCACFRTAMSGIFADLLEKQVPPDPVFDRIWSENIEQLYQE